jgi:hypothetical protein
MGCWHRCGPWQCAPYFHDWPPEPIRDLHDYDEWRIRRRPEWSRPRQPAEPSTAAALEARLGTLRAELERVEVALAELRASGDEDGEQ